MFSNVILAYGFVMFYLKWFSFSLCFLSQREDPMLLVRSIYGKATTVMGERCGSGLVVFLVSDAGSMVGMGIDMMRRKGFDFL